MKVFKFGLTLILSLLVTLSSHGRGDWVGNGAGLAENNLFFVYENIERYIKACLESANCVLDQEQRNLLETILLSMPEERNSEEPQIRIERHSDRFVIDGLPRVAVTGNDVKSPIYFNLDMIYRENNRSALEPISIQQSIALIVHELGHHHGIKDHAWLDLLGSRVARVLDEGVQRLIVNPSVPHLSALAVDVNESHSYDFSTQLLLSDEIRYYDLTSRISRAIKCPRQGHRLGYLKRFRMWNVHWERFFSMRPRLIVNIEMECRANGTTYRWIGDRVLIDPKLEIGNDNVRQWSLRGMSIRVDRCGGGGHECAQLESGYSLWVR